MRLRLDIQRIKPSAVAIKLRAQIALELAGQVIADAGLPAAWEIVGRNDPIHQGTQRGLLLFRKHHRVLICYRVLAHAPPSLPQSGAGDNARRKRDHGSEPHGSGRCSNALICCYNAVSNRHCRRLNEWDVQ
jgi:hypothetical protein